jgi:hypothetical protein
MAPVRASTYIRGPEQRSWRYRFKLHDDPHLMGVGTVADVSLAEARADAAERTGLNTFAGSLKIYWFFGRFLKIIPTSSIG